ncbi:MAG: DUF2095 domain-containing protein [Candidatus Bathyarchaeota archaeon]|nr:DUF2095 domain-containing protein [Candidatus Bathyarchaeota archaeon]
MAEEWFKRLFPHLAKEIESGRSRVRTVDVEGAPEEKAEGNERKWAGYIPDAVDFIRRCETRGQAEEIIDYLENRGEIPSERAAELSRQLEDEGLESFGSRKEEGFYHRDR